MYYVKFLPPKILLKDVPDVKLFSENLLMLKEPTPSDVLNVSIIKIAIVKESVPHLPLLFKPE